MTDDSIGSTAPSKPPSAVPIGGRKCIVVLGMHRSGTSALARVLNLLGATLPKHILGGNNTNPTGHWEPEKLLRANDRLLVEAGSRWDDWRPFNKDTLPPGCFERHFRDIRSLVQLEYEDAKLFVLKEPRISRLVPLYREVLEDIGVQPLYVFCNRNPLGVMASLAKRNDFTKTFSSLVWLRYVLEAESATRNEPRAFLSYEQLLENWRKPLTRVSKLLDLQCPRSADEVASEIDTYLSRDYQHHAPSITELLASPDVTDWVKHAFQALQTLETDPRHPAAMAELSRISAEFDASGHLFGEAFFPELQTRETRLTAQSKQVARKYHEEMEELRERLSEATRQSEQQAAELEEFEERHIEVMRRVEASLKDRENETEKQTGRIHTLEGRLAEAERDNLAVRREIELLQIGERRLRKLHRAAIAQNEDLRSSTSWRVTRPLRALKRAFTEKGFALNLARDKLYGIGRPVRSAARSLRPRPRPAFDETSEPEDSVTAPIVAEGKTPQTAIVIAVYNAAADVARCFESVLKQTPRDVSVIVVDDCSPDTAIPELCARYAQQKNWVILRNEANQGYTRTINIGIAAAGNADVVLLNSDTIVTPQWIQRLRTTAYSAENIATVTPVSNNAGAFSVPQPGIDNVIPSQLTLDGYARAISRTMGVSRVATPTGNGFCMFIRRAVIDMIGTFDAGAFPRGYGEENDFCMRAVGAGWRHLIDYSVFIHHKRSASFGAAKTELMKHGRAIVDQRFPGYKQAVTALSKDSAARAFRERIDGLSNVATNPRPNLLFVISTVTGGTPQTNMDLMRELEARYGCYVLRSDSRKLELSELVNGRLINLEQIDLKKEIAPLPHTSSEYDQIVSSILYRYCIELLHVRHIGWHGLGLTLVARRYGIPVVFSFHDFYTVCPSIKLLDENWKYCGGICTATKGECSVELWRNSQFSQLKHNQVSDWRNRMSEMLQLCDEFVTTSASAQDVIRRTFPWIAPRPFHLIPHGRDIAVANSQSILPSPAHALRILVLGNINEAKGNLVYREIASRFPNWKVEFHLLGNWRGAKINDPRFIYHGPYLRDELEGYIRAIGPHCSAIFSIWPETYCHTLTESWTYSVPVFAFDIGAVGERIAAHGGGWLIKTFSAEGVKAKVDAALADEAGWMKTVADIEAWKGEKESNPTCADMASSYDAIYRKFVAHDGLAPN